jgi:hypothetical protein
MRKSLVTLAIAAGTVTAVGAGTAGYAIATKTVHAHPVAASHAIKPKADPKPSPKPRHHHHKRAKIVYVPQPAAAAPAAPAPAPRSQMTNASAVVMQFYQDINNQDYADAWALGGDNIGGSDYNGWAAGYATTASITVTSYGTWNDGTVWADISALQTDGTTRTYSGTYTVANGVIVSANITQTS